MNKLFSLDSKPMQVLMAVGDYIFLNILFLLCSAPVITMGAAKTALYRVMFDMAEEKGNIYKRFFKIFFSEFLTITPLYLLRLAVLGLLAWEFLIVTANKIAFMLPVLAVLLLTMIIANMIYCSIPAQVSYFNSTRTQYLRNGVYIALTKPLKCLLVSVMELLPVILLLWNAGFVGAVGPLWVFLYFSVTTNLSMRLFKKPFESYVEKAGEAQ